MTDNCSGIQKVETFVVSTSNAAITEVTSSHVDVDCFGQNTGALEVSLSGNNPMFSINSGLYKAIVFLIIFKQEIMMFLASMMRVVLIIL